MVLVYITGGWGRSTFKPVNQFCSLFFFGSSTTGYQQISSKKLVLSVNQSQLSFVNL